MARIHQDVEFAVDDHSGKEHVFHDLAAAQAFAMTIAMQSGGATLDVLVWSEAGARAWGGDHAVEQYDTDPEASVFERFEIRVNFVGQVP